LGLTSEIGICAGASTRRGVPRNCRRVGSNWRLESEGVFIAECHHLAWARSNSLPEPDTDAHHVDRRSGRLRTVSSAARLVAAPSSLDTTAE